MNICHDINDNHAHRLKFGLDQEIGWQRIFEMAYG